jgi:hypothetical protein
MFEEYLQDAYEFLRIAQGCKDEREARRYYRAATFYIAGAIESFLNYVAESFAHAQNLSPHEIAFLTDKNLVYSPEKLNVVERTEYHKLEDKLKVLIRKFIPTLDLGKIRWWSALQEFKDFRDSLVHPRKGEDETKIATYNEKVTSGLRATIQGMNEISQGIFGKAIRKQLLDLMPE